MSVSVSNVYYGGGGGQWMLLCYFLDSLARLLWANSASGYTGALIMQREGLEPHSEFRTLYGESESGPWQTSATLYVLCKKLCMGI